MEVGISKSTLRRELLEYRNNWATADKAKYDAVICHTLMDYLQERKVEVVHTYLPIGTEVDLTPVLRKLLHLGVTLVVPKTLPDGKLLHLRLTDLDDLTVGLKRTFHPRIEIPYDGSYDIIIVPGLAFDVHFHRLGYGGGYYDRFLAKNTTTTKLGVFYKFQKIDQLPVASHDVALDVVLCDGAMYLREEAPSE